MKEKNQNFFFELELEIAFRVEQGAGLLVSISEMLFHSIPPTIQTESFDRNWNDFLMKYGLGDNKWLSDNTKVYIACFWVYLSSDLGVFWRAFRRPLFMNSSLSRSPLLGRDEKHTKEREEQRERKSDAADFYTIIPCATKSSIEAQFQHVYTHEKFTEVRAQFRGKVNCITRSKHSALGYTFVVTYDTVAAEVKCQCLLFELRGILFRHALSVLSFERVNKVLPR
ncbi:hypothetical protein Ahy_A08g039866 [Arachis hypogaea]|uniref:Protein FAR1-RELATED SEQUENCE n=1 Tax=Arachis hypogaea TaxID=3818 RepID=A0A445BY50_ARAHY|nr:hypothetical protein Ahy_A08g039866 [Arachis hypogaea]